MTQLTTSMMQWGSCSYSVTSLTGHKFTGKERDPDTGSDYFGARWFRSSMARFYSPDPVGISNQKLFDPQQWNMYSYSRNNPLRFVDPTGKAIELKGTDEERRKQLEALQKTAGKAGSYLYDNVDKKSGNHFVGIYTNGPDGNGPAFGSINAVANKLGGIIGSERVVGIQFADPGSKVLGTTLGSAPGASPAGTTPRGEQITITRGPLGNMPSNLVEGGGLQPLTLGEVLVHELGHVDAVWFHGVDSNSTSSKGDAVRIENQVRGIEDVPIRTGHDTPYDVPLDNMPY